MEASENVHSSHSAKIRWKGGRKGGRKRGWGGRGKKRRKEKEERKGKKRKEKRKKKEKKEKRNKKHFGRSWRNGRDYCHPQVSKEKDVEVMTPS